MYLLRSYRHLPRHRLLVILFACLCTIVGWHLSLPGTAPAKGSGNLVVSAAIEGPIDPVQLRFVEQVLRQAADERANAIVFTMDTPGGLSTSMYSIVKLFVRDEQRIPVIVYVAPRASEAASAGMYIAFAADIVAMAPSTNIGSATPIQGSGKNIGGDLRNKVINNAVSQVKNIQKDHGRDAVFAEKAIRKGENITADEAFKQHVIDLKATTLPKLLDAIDGRVTKPKGLKVHTKDATIRHINKPLSLKILGAVINPNIVFLLFSAGLLGLAFEITHPGVIFPGVVGALCFITAMFGLQILPITTTGVLLLVLAVVLFVAEAFVMSHGVLGVGGAIAFFLGGLMLFESNSGLGVDIPVLVFVALTLAGFFGLIVTKAMAARRQPVTTGSDELIGAIGRVRKPLQPNGQIFINGELWSAHMTGDQVAAIGDEVRVASVEGLLLYVTTTNAIEDTNG